MADDWLVISSAEYDSHCGDDGSNTLEEALDGTSAWKHAVNETHWFILDLGQTYTIKKVRGRSATSDDPDDVDIYVSDSKVDWGTAVATAITNWTGTFAWVEADTTDKDGRYIKVVINSTEDSINRLEFGYGPSPFTIFDAYGDVAGGAALTHTASDTMTISDSIATASVMKHAKSDTMTIGDAIATVSVMKHAAADAMAISDTGGVIASLAMKLALADQMDISDSVESVLSEAEIAAIRRLRMIYGLKPARVPKIGHIGV